MIHTIRVTNIKISKDDLLNELNHFGDTYGLNATESGGRITINDKWTKKKKLFFKVTAKVNDALEFGGLLIGNGDRWTGNVTVEPNDIPNSGKTYEPAACNAEAELMALFAKYQINE